MTRPRWKRITLLVLCMGLSILWSQHIRRVNHDGISMADFGEIYFGAKCALHHHDPYDAGAVLSEFKADGGAFPVKNPTRAKIVPIVILLGVNLPTSLFIVAPLAIISWGMAQIVWLSLTSALLVIAGYLGWSLADDAAPVLAGCLIGFMLLNCTELLHLGNVAGIAVSLCAIATWCFARQRYAAAGVVLLAFSLALKPHDSGFIWLYFLLAGGVTRKRALQTVSVTAIIGILAAIWIAPYSPHWPQELHRNHEIVSQVGSTSDPAISGLASGSILTILDLQAAFSYFLKTAHAYNLASYVVAGGLIAVWAFVVIRRRTTPEATKLAIAAIAVLTLLPVYHRPYDAKLLMLSVPACAMLWAKGGVNRWISFGLTLTAVLLTSDIPLAILLDSTKALGISASLPPDKSVVLLLLPPFALLAMGSYFLWTFIRYVPSQLLHARQFAANEPVAVCAVHSGVSR